MEAPKRVFPFEGSDEEYINYLESMLLEAQIRLQTSSRPSHQSRQSPTNPRSGQRHFINLSDRSFIKVPNQRRFVQQPRTPQWEREFNKFLSSIPNAQKWSEAREATGFASVEKNRLAIQLLLGRPASSEASVDAHHREIPSLRPADDQDMIVRGCDYGRFVIRCEDDGKFAVRVAKYQQLVFVCYCTVLIHVGNSKDTVNWMMRQFISDSDDKNLERYRSGCLWVNRCIADLLKHRWGYKSWEIFMLFAQPLHQYGRFADNKRSFEKFTQFMGRGDAAIFEEGWVPYCLPCIVKFIAGDKIE
ncbi:hypothetical protein N7461_004633 [Penicillium sp. DV-2018c]|nr:hypothetical protein N7461_004633 [Penicillium sp. DV-2018c]